MSAERTLAVQALNDAERMLRADAAARGKALPRTTTARMGAAMLKDARLALANPGAYPHIAADIFSGGAIAAAQRRAYVAAVQAAQP